MIVFDHSDRAVRADGRAASSAGAAEVCAGTATKNQQLPAAANQQSTARERHCSGTHTQTHTYKHFSHTEQLHQNETRVKCDAKEHINCSI